MRVVSPFYRWRHRGTEQLALCLHSHSWEKAGTGFKPRQSGARYPVFGPPSCAVQPAQQSCRTDCRGWLWTRWVTCRGPGIIPHPGVLALLLCLT